MTDEELSMEFVLNYPKIEKGELLTTKDLQNAYLAGLKASRPKWHNVTAGDLPKGEKYGRDGVHRDIYLKDRYGKLYTGNYFPKDENHEEDCFTVEILDWGFRGSQFCKKEQISEWCEIPQYTEE